MNKFEDIFNVDSIKKVKEEQKHIDNKTESAEEAVEENEEISTELVKCETLEKQIQAFQDTDGHSNDMDQVAKVAMESYVQLMETGDNFADTKYAAKFYEVANSMLKNALDAKNSKVLVKIKKMELLLKAEKQSQNTNNNDHDSEEGTIIATRSEVLDAINDTNKDLDKLK